MRESPSNMPPKLDRITTGPKRRRRRTWLISEKEGGEIETQGSYGSVDRRGVTCEKKKVQGRTGHSICFEWLQEKEPALTESEKGRVNGCLGGGKTS